MRIRPVLLLLKVAQWSALLPIAISSVAVCGPAQNSAESASGFKVDETLLGPFYWVAPMQGMAPPDLSVSADGRHVAYVSHGSECQPVGSKVCIFVDGHPSPVSDKTWVENLWLSADGKRLAYVEKVKGGGDTLVVDGVLKPGCGGLPVGSLVFSPDGKRVACLGVGVDIKHPTARAVVDGEVGQQYDQVTNLIFSPDSNRVAYAARTDKKWVAVVDGQPGPQCDAVWGPAFGPDSKHVVYAQRQGKQWSVVVDGRAGAAYDVLPTDAQIGEHTIGSADIIPAIWSKMDGQLDGTHNELGTNVFGPIGDQFVFPVAFSADSKHLAYVAWTRGGWVVVEDGKEGPGAMKIGVGSPAIGPNGELAYSAKTCCSFKEGPWKMIADGQEGTEGYDKLFNPSLSPDGKRVAFAAEKVEFGKMQDWVFVVDGQIGARNVAIGNWTFSADSKHVAYVAQPHQGFSLDYPWGGGAWEVFLDGKAGAEYSVVIPDTLRFGSDGALEFLAARKDGHSLVENHGSLYRVRYTPTP
jgi:hypothetical protein